jgi:DNA-binding phage protein
MTTLLSSEDEAVSRAERLVKQSKRCQIFGEKAEEAAKTAEAASLYLAVALGKPNQEHLTEAKACLARSLSLCRLLLKMQRKKERMSEGR